MTWRLDLLAWLLFLAWLAGLVTLILRQGGAM